jgi:hypothetical protein
MVLVPSAVFRALFAFGVHRVHSVYFVNAKKPEDWTLEEQLAGKCLAKPQFGRVAARLGCKLIPAATPQVKGRIERFWRKKIRPPQKRQADIKVPETND